MLYYIIFIVVLFLIYFLFAYDLKVRLIFDFNSLKLKVFFIPLIILKGDKYKKFLKRLIPRNRNEVMQEIDTTLLVSLFHFHKLRIEVSKNVVDYLNYVFIQNVCIITNYILVNLIKENIENYHFIIKEDKTNNLKIDSMFHFNLGIILINLYLIRRRYNHVQKAD